MKVVLGCRFYSNQSDDDNSGKLIQLVVTSLRVDRVAASGLGIARRWTSFSTSSLYNAWWLILEIPILPILQKG